MDEIVIGDMVYTPNTAFLMTEHHANVKEFRKMKIARSTLLSKINDAEHEVMMLNREISFIREIERNNRKVEQRKQTIEHKRLMLEELLKYQSRKYKID